MKQRRISDIIPKVVDDEVGKRASGRVPFDADIRFLHPGDVTGVAVDASEGGLRVVTASRLEPGTRCIAVVQLADGEETHERMEVVWSHRSAEGWVAGLAFAS
ncbi:MAG: PilZ domain-containing protein [Polyangiaceae bacterium]